jgi:hypothetical protein
MKLGGLRSTGSFDFFATHERIKSIVGHATSFSEFVPKHCPERYAVDELLKELLKFYVFCTITEEFPAYIVGRFEHYEAAIIFIADDGNNNPHCLTLQFQSGGPFETFPIGALMFTMLSSSTVSIIDYRITWH